MAFCTAFLIKRSILDGAALHSANRDVKAAGCLVPAIYVGVIFLLSYQGCEPSARIPIYPRDLSVNMP